MVGDNVSKYCAPFRKSSTMKRYFLILVVLSLGTASSSLTAQNSAKEIPVEFFKIFKTDPIKAMDYAFSTNEWMKRNQDGVESVKSKFKDILPLIGDYYGYELITEKSIGENLSIDVPFPSMIRTIPGVLDQVRQKRCPSRTIPASAAR